MKKEIVGLIRIYRYIIKTMDELEKLGIYYEVFGKEIDEIGDIILNLLGIPEDNIIYYLKKYGEGWHKKKGVFCRDGFINILLDDDHEDAEVIYKMLIKERDMCK